MKNIVFKILIVCVVVTVAVLMVLNWGEVSRLNNASMATEDSALEHAALHVDPNYVCPMHSQITDTKPSSCPICGMDLELREVSKQGDSDGVFVSAAMVNNLGVRIEHVETGSVSEEVYASGYVELVSKAQEESLKSKVTGQLVKVFVQQGQWVEKGDVLVTVEVATYYDTLTQYIEAMENAQITKGLKLRKKLVMMGASDEVLAGYDQDKPLSKNLEIVAPFSGEVTWVIENKKSDSSNIEIGSRLAQISAPSLAEVELRTYSRVARGVKIGHTGLLGVAHMPGRVWPGRVVEVDHSRAGFYSTLRFHVLVPYGVMEAGAFGGAYVNAGTANDVLRVPTDAVIYDESSIRVVRLKDDDSFEAVEVVLGFEGHKWIEVTSGLQEGDHVVTRGQFLIDSEATLQAGFKRLSNK